MKRDAETRRLRAKWRYRGDVRPPFAQEPGPGQESVWDYPRPPRIEPDARPIRVESGGVLLASSSRAVRVLETAGAPTFYLPPADVAMERLRASDVRTFCEWKGEAVGYDVAGGPENAAWSYPEPFDEFAPVAGWIAFYPALVACEVDGEPVRPQPGGYYGGWVTAEIVGPFKGEPGVPAV